MIFGDLKMADDGAISNGSDIDDRDTEIGSNTGSFSTSLSSESDLEERHAVGGQCVRNLFVKMTPNDSVFAGFQAAWKVRNFMQRISVESVGHQFYIHQKQTRGCISTSSGLGKCGSNW